MDELLEWLRTNGGYLHPSTRLTRDEKRGCYLEAEEYLPNRTLVVHVPHSMVLSCLNAMVDDNLPVLKANADSFSVEALGVFYLMSQWLQKDTSFWRPYLNVLNSPETGFNTPFWFDEEDLVWLKGTDLLTSFQSRKETWQQYWRDGTAILNAEGMDVSRYTWDLCKWATTVYTSRSLSSRAVRPQDSKYWTGYKQGPRGRQTVLLDFSRVPEERKDFPVLIPGMDFLNHHHDAHVDWTFEPGRFVLTLGGDVAKGNEVLNNYGPKSNSELLMGYGFCVEDNPFDSVFEALKPPPPELQPALKRIHPGFFTTHGKWNTEAATFQLREWRSTGGSGVWDSIPINLTELFYYMVLHERGLPVKPIEGDTREFLLAGSGRRYLPRIAFLVFSSLLPKMTKIAESDPDLPTEPKNEKQRNAKIYRDGQRRILSSLREGLLKFQHSLRPQLDNGTTSRLQSPAQPYTMTLEDAASVLKAEHEKYHEQFLAGVMAGFGVNDLADTRGTNVEQQIWVLYLCFTLVLIAQGMTETQQGGLVNRQVISLLHEYSGGQLEVPDIDEDADDPEGQAFLNAVKRAAAAVSVPGGESNIWSSELWSCSFILDWGLRIARSQGMQMRVADNDVRYVVYLHVDDEDEN
ncbi:SET domain-containing protein [Myriangium duriaei CBS 260.36]|uniref:SET domain-containing protein n=1 Tax=Myriangium duriaei CBS 260.36 TaxID=1168546 RepID=A0A9P4MGS2_9PEZI|nr:SET domain-containing protein [Myriangium duriaei CBS 260.36]